MHLFKGQIDRDMKIDHGREVKSSYTSGSLNGFVRKTDRRVPSYNQAASSSSHVTCPFLILSLNITKSLMCAHWVTFLGLQAPSNKSKGSCFFNSFYGLEAENGCSKFFFSSQRQVSIIIGTDLAFRFLSPSVVYLPVAFYKYFHESSSRKVSSLVARPYEFKHITILNIWNSEAYPQFLC